MKYVVETVQKLDIVANGDAPCDGKVRNRSTGTEPQVRGPGHVLTRPISFHFDVLNHRLYDAPDWRSPTENSIYFQTVKISRSMGISRRFCGFKICSGNGPRHFDGF